LADKRRKRQQDQADTNLANHLDALGLKGVKAYQQWCADNGFSRRLIKSQSDRRKERQAVVDANSGSTTVHAMQIDRSRGKAIDLIFEEKLKFADLRDRQQQALALAISRLNHLPKTGRANVIEQFRSLYFDCQRKKVKFLEGGIPSASTQTRSCSFVEALASVASFSDQWIRPVSDWKFRTHNQRRQFDSLVTHLFVAHDMPSFFYNTWFHPLYRKGKSAQKAFVHVAAGHSIRRANIPLVYSKRMSHHFLRAPSDSNFAQALRWGQVHGLGGDPLLAKAVMGSALGEKFENNEFWQSVLEWFIQHPMFDRALFPVIYDYLRNQKFGDDRNARIEIGPAGNRRLVRPQPEQPNLTMKGRTPTSLMRDVDGWHRQLQRAIIRHGTKKRSWSASPIAAFRLAEGEKENRVWTISELLDSDELFQEGRAMNHCVGSYANSCARRVTSIWSMKRTEKSQSQPVLTIEVQLGNRVICQVRGKSNRAAKANELKVIQRWAQTAELTLAKYLK
jgi:hypothetical protein